jgi:hypothetical protein
MGGEVDIIFTSDVSIGVEQRAEIENEFLYILVNNSVSTSITIDLHKDCSGTDSKALCL